jgi:hypothetical protein
MWIGGTLLFVSIPVTVVAFAWPFVDGMRRIAEAPKLDASTKEMLVLGVLEMLVSPFLSSFVFWVLKGIARWVGGFAPKQNERQAWNRKGRSARDTERDYQRRIWSDHPDNGGDIIDL